LAGLKPLLIVLIQLPIFVALYHLLGQHFELRDQPFLWMPSLAEPDQLFSFGFDVPFFGSYFNLLPAFMALTTLLTIKLSPAPAADDKAAWKQNLMLAGLAIGFFVLFYTFPSGMVLYWTAANVLHLLHAAVTKKSSG
jgi:YidC/Oxa1 family membrane protein insertase